MTLRFDPDTGCIVSDKHEPVAFMHRGAHDRDLTLGHKMAAAEEMFEAGTLIDKYSLVIESAVRNADIRNHPSVVVALKAMRDALSKANP